MFLGYIKDCNNIAAKPKAFVRVSLSSGSTIKEDLLASAKSSFSITGLPSNINNGDIFTVYDSKGVQWYTGKITSYSDTKIDCTQIQSIFSGIWLCQNIKKPTIEEELREILKVLVSGKVGNYTDQFIRNKFSAFDINCVPSTSGELPTFEENETMDFEKFIYQMYEQYGIVFDINIPYEGRCSVNIFKPNYDKIIVSDNTRIVASISPTLEIGDNNKLVIFGRDGTYRSTWVVTDDMTPRIVCLDNQTANNRFVETKTKIVFSDDDEDTIVKSNLTEDMYNHKVDFIIKLENKIYRWEDFKMGMPLEVWNGTDWYNTVFTGYDLSIPSGGVPTTVKVVCGKVRLSLTDKMLRGSV